MSTSPPEIQLYDQGSMERIERIRSIIEGSITELDSWSAEFQKNLDSLYAVTPFSRQPADSSVSTTFEQEFRGEWSAVSEAINMDVVVSQHKDTQKTQE